MSANNRKRQLSSNTQTNTKKKLRRSARIAEQYRNHNIIIEESEDSDIVDLVSPSPILRSAAPSPVPPSPSSSPVPQSPSLVPPVVPKKKLTLRQKCAIIKKCKQILENADLSKVTNNTILDELQQYFTIFNVRDYFDWIIEQVEIIVYDLMIELEQANVRKWHCNLKYCGRIMFYDQKDDPGHLHSSIEINKNTQFTINGKRNRIPFQCQDTTCLSLWNEPCVRGLKTIDKTALFIIRGCVNNIDISEVSEVSQISQHREEKNEQKEEKNEQREVDCPVCQEEVLPNRRAFLTCLHVVHRVCKKQLREHQNWWFRHFCIICRIMQNVNGRTPVRRISKIKQRAMYFSGELLEAVDILYEDGEEHIRSLSGLRFVDDIGVQYNFEKIEFEEDCNRYKCVIKYWQPIGEVGRFKRKECWTPVDFLEHLEDDDEI